MTPPDPTPRRWPKRVMLAVLLLALGSILNTAIAWACVLWSPVHPAAAAIDNEAVLKLLPRGHRARIAEVPGLSPAWRASEVLPNDTPWWISNSGIYQRGFGLSYHVASARFVSNPAAPEQTKPRNTQAWLMRAGWPFRSFSILGTGEASGWSTITQWKVEGEWMVALPTERAAAARVVLQQPWNIRFGIIPEQGIVIASGPSTYAQFAAAAGWLVAPPPPPTVSILLPIRPEPLGFLLNAAAYGWAARELCLIPGALKRWRRRRNGKCEHCGYETGELAVCPECGKKAIPHMHITTPSGQAP